MPLIDGHGSSNVSQLGRFIQGTNAAFVLKFFDINGHSYNPTDISVTIVDSTGTTVQTTSGLNKIDTGEFAVDYSIPVDGETGVYTLSYTFTSHTTSGDETRTIDENFVVIEKASATSELVQSQRNLMSAYLETLLRTTQRIPVKNEQVIWDKTRTRAKLTFGNWNQPAGARVYRNNNLITEGFEVDYLNGEILFDTPLETTDIVNVDYNFRWFSDELDYFMDSGIQRVNLYPPVTTYTFGTVPEYWVFVSMWGAAVDAIRTLILDLIHQQPQIVFGGPDAAQKAIDILDGQKRNYEEDLKAALDMKKNGPYLGLMHMNIQPEYSLPGSRSRWFRFLYSSSM